jgi:NADP-dependent 3-hydroxy acid dehydrogenase YdfG
LLETTWDVWVKHNIKGHIINIGSTAELMGIDDVRIDSIYGSYSIQKRALRDRSLQLNNKKEIKTSHIIAGGLNDGKPGHEKWLALDSIAKIIDYVIQHPDHIPLIEIHSA